MIKLHETLPPGCMSGQICTFLQDKLTGMRTFLRETHNVIAYTAADLMARIVAGDSTYLPQHVGFIYGTDYSPLLDDPDSLPLETRRLHDWARVTTDVASIGGNVAIVPLAQSPTVGRDGSATLYTANAVTFSAHTGLTTEYAFPTNGSTFAQTLAALEESEYGQDVYFYHALLLNRWESNGQITYTPFARAALASPPFEPRPASHELGLFWTITFR